MGDGEGYRVVYGPLPLGSGLLHVNRFLAARPVVTQSPSFSAGTGSLVTVNNLLFFLNLST